MKKVIYLILLLSILSPGCFKPSSGGAYILITFNEGTTRNEAYDLLNKYNVSEEMYEIDEVKMGTTDENTYNGLMVTIDTEYIDDIDIFCYEMNNESIVSKCIIDHREA